MNSFPRSTYATTVRDSKRARERDFLKAVSIHQLMFSWVNLYCSTYFMLCSKAHGVGRLRVIVVLDHQWFQYKKYLYCACWVWQVHKCVAAGGKVLIPVFALGRAQVGLVLSLEMHFRGDILVKEFISLQFISFCDKIHV